MPLQRPASAKARMAYNVLRLPVRPAKIVRRGWRVGAVMRSLLFVPTEY